MTSNVSIATGDFLFFFQDQFAFTVPGAGVASRTSLPGAADPAWRSLGNVESCDIMKTGEKEEVILAPTGQKGVLSAKDAIQTINGLELKVISNEISVLAMQCFYHTQDLADNAAQFNPSSAVPPKGWLKVQRFDQTGAAHLVMDVFVRLKCTGGMKSGDGTILKPEWSALVLYSALNSAAI